jgi:hypothetical protein
VVKGVDSIDFPRPVRPDGRSLFLDEAIEFVHSFSGSSTLIVSYCQQSS